jgi:hypothetical protein
LTYIFLWKVKKEAAMRWLRFFSIAIAMTIIVFSACDCGTNSNNNNNGNGNTPPPGGGDYFLSGNIGNLLLSGGSFQLEVSRLDSSLSTGANDAVVTLNGASVPMITGSPEDAIFVKNNIGFAPGAEYIVVVTIGSLSSTCNITVEESWNIEITSPSQFSTWTPGNPVTVTWSYSDGAPDSIEFIADDANETSDEYDYYVVVSGANTSHTIPGSVTSGLEGELWIDVCPKNLVWWFTGNLHATASFVVQTFACDAIILNESGSTSEGYLYLDAVPGAIPADGSSSCNIIAYVSDGLGNPVPNGTSVNFSTNRGTIIPSSSTTIDGEASAVLTSSATPGTATVIASSGSLSDSIPVEFYEVVDVQISVGPGAYPAISWTPSSELAFALNVGAIGVVIPKWTIVSATGFPSPVTFGTLPSGATQTVPMSGSPAGLVSGTQYRITLVTAGDDTTFYTFTR